MNEPSEDKAVGETERQDGPARRDLDRRDLLGVGSAAIVTAMLGATRARGQSMNDVSQAEHGVSSSDPGPENTPIQGVEENAFMPPDTDHGLTPTFWDTFSAAHRRVEQGGWSRQINVKDFSISKEITGVNMRLTPGGIRELHWHNAGEWAIMLDGKARITVIDNAGKGFVDDVGVNDLWFFPTGNPHSIQGLEPNGCEFLLVFDKGDFTEEDTTLLTDWLRHVPRDVLAKNWGVPADALNPVYQVPPSGYYIFQRAVPPPLHNDIRAVSSQFNGRSPLAFSFPMSTMKPTFQGTGGLTKVVDSRNFPVNNSVAGVYVVLHPGAMRVLHWHQNADEWQYYVEGQGRMTAFFNRSLANTFDFSAGDVGYVPRTLPHYIENTGKTDLIFLEMFKSPIFQELTISQWLHGIPPELAIDHLGVSMQTLQQLPKTDTPIIPV